MWILGLLFFPVWWNWASWPIKIFIIACAAGMIYDAFFRPKTIRRSTTAEAKPKPEIKFEESFEGRFPIRDQEGRIVILAGDYTDIKSWPPNCYFRKGCKFHPDAKFRPVSVFADAPLWLRTSNITGCRITLLPSGECVLESKVNYIIET